MPKKSGQDLKTVRLAPTRPQPKARSIMRFDPPAPGPHFNPPTSSNALAAEALRIAKNPGNID